MSDLSSRGGKRTSADSEESSRKKAKKEEGQGEKYNPYLAHMQQENGFDSESSPLSSLKIRETTAEQAAKIEDLSTNAFTGQEHSQKYFQILETRRDLPVHKQRFVDCHIFLAKRKVY
jgi:pre-mRNA-splicing factor ATP-dependent RNA helicase DHX15/PRP43